MAPVAGAAALFVGAGAAPGSVARSMVAVAFIAAIHRIARWAIAAGGDAQFAWKVTEKASLRVFIAKVRTRGA